MQYDIIGFALASVAVLVAVLALAAILVMGRWFYLSSETLKARISACESGIKRTSSAELAATVAGLEGSVAALANSMRKQFGTVFGKLGQIEQRDVEDDDDEPPRPTRAELRQRYLRNPITGGNGGE